MNTKFSVLTANYFTKKINWKLLILLILLLNVKLLVKLIGVFIIYLLQPNLKFNFELKNSRLPLFYPAVIAIAVFNFILYSNFSNLNYGVAFIIGISFWGACILIIHQIKIFVDQNATQIIYNTLIIFFLINCFASLAELIRIIIETGALNPYRYQGNFQKYFINTGDHIKGISLDTSTTNAALNAFGVIFFLYKRNWLMLLACTFTLLLAGSNFVNLILFLTLAFLFLFKTDRIQKSITVVCFIFLVVFMVKVSPQNNQYINEFFNKTFTKKNSETTNTSNKAIEQHSASVTLTEDERKENFARNYLDSVRQLHIQTFSQESSLAVAPIDKSKPIIPEADIHSEPFQKKTDTNAVRRTLIEFIEHKQPENTNDEIYTSRSLPGKFLALEQTVNFFKARPFNILTGIGIGNFSSKLAFKTTALNISGGYPDRFIYIDPNFSANHLNLYLHYFSKDYKLHSILHNPNSVYDQLLSEYGIVGIGAFFILYIGYFLKQYKKLTYGIPLIVLLLGFCFVDYWFEQLSIIIIFELLLLLNIKENAQ